MNNRDLKEISKFTKMDDIEFVDKENGVFEFSCSICGECCKNRDDIMLSPYDIFRLSKELKISSYDVIEKYCDVHLGENSNLPIVTLRFKESNNYTVCPFLKFKEGLYKCIVHRYKPSVCALFPLGRVSKSDKNKENIIDFEYIVQPNTCNFNKREQHTVKEWLSNFNMNDSEQAFIDWSNCIMYLQKTMNLNKFFNHKKISKNSKNMIYNGILSGLYNDINTDNNILEELNQKYEQTKHFIGFMVAIYYTGFNIDVRGIDYKPDLTIMKEVEETMNSFSKEQIKSLI